MNPLSPNSVDLTSRNLASVMGPVSATQGVHVSFRWDSVTLKSKDPKLNGTKQRRLVVIRQPKGDRSTVATAFLTAEEPAKKYPVEYSYFTAHAQLPKTRHPPH